MNSPTQNVFISYAHEDDGLRDELVKHLAVLRQQGLISDWHDRQIRAGQSWEAEIARNIQISDLVLLLVSPDFLSSPRHKSTQIMRPSKQQYSWVIPIGFGTDF